MSKTSKIYLLSAPSMVVMLTSSEQKGETHLQVNCPPHQQTPGSAAPSPLPRTGPLCSLTRALRKLLNQFPAHPNSSAAFESTVNTKDLNTGKTSTRSKVKDGKLNQNRDEEEHWSY